MLLSAAGIIDWDIWYRLKVAGEANYFKYGENVELVLELTSQLELRVIQSKVKHVQRITLPINYVQPAISMSELD